jgi:hypothetical protein
MTGGGSICRDQVQQKFCHDFPAALPLWHSPKSEFAASGIRPHLGVTGSDLALCGTRAKMSVKWFSKQAASS